MRLDDYLLKMGVKAKETAVYLIKNGHVLVNNCAVTHQEIPVDENDDVKILDEKYLDVPGSFWKLKGIQREINLIQMGDLVLDVESVDGGFPVFAKEMGAQVLVLTIGDRLDFLKQYPEINVKKCNIMTIKPEEISGSKVDLIINELNLDIMKSFQILGNFMSLLSSRGKVLMFLPTRERTESDLKEVVEKLLGNFKLGVIEFFKAKRGIYVYAKRV